MSLDHHHVVRWNQQSTSFDLINNNAKPIQTKNSEFKRHRWPRVVENDAERQSIWARNFRGLSISTGLPHPAQSSLHGSFVVLLDAASGCSPRILAVDKVGRSNF